MLAQRSYLPWGKPAAAMKVQMVEDMKRWDAIGEKAKSLR